MTAETHPIAAAAPAPMLDGGGDPAANADTEVFMAGTAAFDGLIAEDDTQHNPQVPDGLAAVTGLFGGVGPVDAGLVRLIAQGDLVFAHSHYRTFNSAIVDIFRLEGGRIVEHWDVIQEIPATTASGSDMTSQRS